MSGCLGEVRYECQFRPSYIPPGDGILRRIGVLGSISITAVRCVAWRFIALSLTIARHATPRNTTRSRNGNRPLDEFIAEKGVFSGIIS